MSQQQRILFAIPWGQRVILGATDTDYQGSIEAVHAEPADVAYILEVVNDAFPQAGLSESDAIGVWAGLRPLIASSRGGPSDISRAHQILMPEPGWFDVAGGKLTSHRLIAQQVVDRLFSHLGRAAVPCRTADQPLLESQQTSGFSGILPPEVCAEVVRHYCEQEWAEHLDDVMVRRTSWHYYRADAAAIAARVCDWMAISLGWDQARCDAELQWYRRQA
jgi:glycerol-3-phosphate dehydrogenase